MPAFEPEEDDVAGDVHEEDFEAGVRQNAMELQAADAGICSQPEEPSELGPLFAAEARLPGCPVGSAVWLLRLVDCHFI